LKNNSGYFILIIFLIISGCSEKKNKLIVDEIYISKHRVGPLPDTIRFTPPDIAGRNDDQKFSYDIDEPHFKYTEISHSGYCPVLIIKLNIDGNLTGYYYNSQDNKDGYFSFMLPDSMLNYFNRQIEKMNYKKLDTLYYNASPGSLYCGPEYFISIKNGDEEKQVFILNEYVCPGNIIKFINNLYNYAENLKLSTSAGKYFRRDTLIVLKSEKYQEYIFNKKYPDLKYR
jgi:hypothetical protein